MVDADDAELLLSTLETEIMLPQDELGRLRSSGAVDAARELGP